MTIKVMRVAALAALLYGARQYWRNWGATKDECGITLPGDELLAKPVVASTEAVWIDRPPEQIWPWLVRMGTSSHGMYAYRAADAAVGSIQDMTSRPTAPPPGFTVGDGVTLVASGLFGRRDGIVVPVEQVIAGESLVLHGRPPAVPWDVVWSIHLLPRWNDRCRVLVRTRVGLRHPGEVVPTVLLGPAFAMLTRRMLLTIKRLSECRGAPADDPVEVVSM
ncbi:SRPBCC family protein [Mycolicibacterium sp. 22603]|uniref:SRPBCC family protein n=1 Tax=Mycolicibacterium sp. 22603 TaxID=3453950 RepID=UPI003F857819